MIDYSESLHSFVGIRKHLLKDQKYYCYIFPN